jgi:hypothetical protein
LLCKYTLKNISSSCATSRTCSFGIIKERFVQYRQASFGLGGERIGKDESLGCVRMEKGDVEELFDLVPIGTKVKIVTNGLPGEIKRANTPFKVPQKEEETNPKKVYKWLN